MTLTAPASCSSVGNEDFHDLSLETQSGQQVVLSDTDREALIMGMTLHDKAQQLLNKVSFSCSNVCNSTRTTFLSKLGTMIRKTCMCARAYPQSP